MKTKYREHTKRLVTLRYAKSIQDKSFEHLDICANVSDGQLFYRLSSLEVIKSKALTRSSSDDELEKTSKSLA